MGKKRPVPPLWLGILGNTIHLALFASLFVLVAEVLQRRSATNAAVLAARREQAAVAHEVLESRLAAMQAQVEPQFLFNSLVGIEALYRKDADAAAENLDRLIQYLRVALPRLREPGSTIAGEIDLVRAYLAVVTSLHGGRPALTVTLGEDCARRALLPDAAAAADPARRARAGRAPAGVDPHRRAEGPRATWSIVTRIACSGGLRRGLRARPGARAAQGPLRRPRDTRLRRTRGEHDAVHPEGARRSRLSSRPMSTPTAIIAEDEATLRGQLVEQLGQLWPELAIVGEAADGVQALRLLDEHRPDVMFLDIQMPGATGLEVARQASGRCHVVFVTAYDQHAVAAFDQGAVDYVLKPVSAARLFTAVSRLKQRLGTPPARLDATLSGLAGAAAPPPAAARQYLRWINASVGQNVKLITVDEISYFQADNKYTRVVTGEGEALIRKPLKELVEELDPNQFWQIHRSTLVNAMAIAGVTRDFRGRMLVKLKSRPETLLVSDSYTHLFRQM